MDLVYLTPGADNYDFLTELRFQSLEKLDLGVLRELADMSKSEKLLRAVRHIAALVEQEREEEL